MVSSSKRPEFLAVWQKRARKLKVKPTSLGADMLALWKAWYLDISPDWRGARWPLSKKIPRDGCDWSEYKGGPNGIYMLVLALSWCSLPGSTPSAEFIGACDEFAWLLLELAFIKNEDLPGAKRQIVASPAQAGSSSNA